MSQANKTEPSSQPPAAPPLRTFIKEEYDDNDDDTSHKKTLFYQSGFGNTLESECLPGALPVGRNNPRRVPFGAYAEQLSGTAFTATPRHDNRRTWLYRIQPSVVVAETTSRPVSFFGGCTPQECQPHVDPLRWRPLPDNDDAGSDNPDQTWVEGCRLLCHGGDPATKNGLAMYLYSCSRSMKDDDTGRASMYNADGDFLLVPQRGALEVVTEVGILRVEPTEICVLPRGMVFQINLVQGGKNETTTHRGYVLEVYNGTSFQLPGLGPIGSNGLANVRDFLHPVASCDFATQQEYRNTAYQIYAKKNSQLFCKESDHSPFNVVAWHGNYLPYKYDLKRFCVVNSVSYDHLDPSIYTVLTCPSAQPGTAIADFVIFPPRVMATDSNTLRPPWFHRNTMSEFMGLIYGAYDAKREGFLPGGATLHNNMTPHGPDTASYEAAVADKCASPTKFDAGLAFMFETSLQLNVAPSALENHAWREVNYADCWQGLSDESFSGWQALAQAAAQK